MAGAISTFQKGRLSLNYQRIGSGAHAILAFHGFGRTSADFEFLTPSIADQYSFYSFDCFFHGSSKGPNDSHSPLDPKEWSEFTHSFLQKMQHDTVSFVAYSMGGRLALSIIENSDLKIDKVLLLAPDGIIRNPWYSFASRTFMGRRLFKCMRDSPGVFMSIARAFNKAGLLDRKMLDVAIYNTSSKNKREQLYSTWTFLGRIWPDLKQLEKVLMGSDLELKIVLGRYDAMIPPNNILKWSYLANNQDIVIIEEEGHRLVETVLMSHFVRVFN